MTSTIPPPALLDLVGFREFRRQVREEYELCRSQEASFECVDTDAEISASVRTRWDALDPAIRARFYHTGAYNTKLSKLSQSARCGLQAQAASPTIQLPTVRHIVKERWIVVGPSSEKDTCGVKSEKKCIKPVKKKRKSKNDNLPKKPRSPYLLFYLDEAEKLKTEEPEMSLVNRSKEITRRWASLDAAAKKVYDQRNSDDKARYAQEMASYIPPAPKPKQSLSAYLFYVKDRCSEIKMDNESKSKGMVLKRVSEEWKAMDAEAKKRFHEKSIMDKKRYQREMAMFRQGKFVSSTEGSVARDSDGEDPCQSDESMLPSQGDPLLPSTVV